MRSQSKQEIWLSAFDEFRDFPYYRNVPRDGRTIFLNPLFNHEKNEWVLLIQVSSNKLQRIMGGEPIVSSYLGFQAADPKKDFEFGLGTFVIQQVSFPGMAGPLFTLEDDIHNCSAILEKFLLISNRDKSQRDGLTLLLRTELEYLIVVIRSIYDLLQKLSKNATALVREIEEPKKRVIENLPDSFADVVLSGDQIRSTEQIQEKFHLPVSLANFYASEANHFQWLRNLRVAIEHHGQTIHSIFDLDEGVAISIQEIPWNSLPIWQEPKLIRNEHLGSLRAVFNFLVSDVIDMTTRYANAFTASVPLPLAIELGMKLFVRNHFSHHLVNLRETTASPWERLSV